MKVAAAFDRAQQAVRRLKFANEHRNEQKRLAASVKTGCGKSRDLTIL